MFGISWPKLGIGFAVLVAIGLAAFGLKAMVNKIDQQGQQIMGLKTELAGEKAARKADVAGLTVLSQGVVAASSARALDDKILAETIDAKNPQPSSPGLAHFLDGLRNSDAASGPANAAGSAHQPAAAGAGGPKH